MKIAIVGTGSGWENAPFDDPTWEIWTIPGLYNSGKRMTQVFEVHSAQNRVKHGMTKERLEWMKENVTVCHPTLATTCKNARIIDFEGLMAKFGRYFTSSISWILAEAIDAKPEEISIFGVTMASDGEYAHQKPACSYFIGWAKANGIKVTIQRSAELMSAPYIYGYEEKPDFLVSLAASKTKCKQIMDHAEAEFHEYKAKFNHAEGYMNCIKDIENNFHSGSRS